MRALALTLALALGLLAGPALAQDPNAPQAAAPAPAPAPEPPPIVPGAEVVTRSEEIKNLLKDMEARAAPDAAEQEVQSQLPALSAKLRERSARADEVLSKATSIETIVDLSNEWDTRAVKLTGWRHSLTRRAIGIESVLDQINIEQDRWARTREAAAAAGLPAGTRERIDETLAAISATEKAVKKRRTHVLALQNDVAQEELIVSGILDRAEALRAELQSRLFARDEPPLWSPAAWEATSGLPTLDDLRANLADNVEELGEFGRLGGSQVVLQLLCFAAVAGALLLSRTRVLQASQDDPTLHAAARIFERPFSSAIVVATASGALFGRQSQTIALEVQGLLLLIPMLRILPKELYGAMRPGLIGLSIVFAGGMLRSLVASSPVLERLRLLVEALAGIALYLWILRPDHAAALRQIGRFAWAVLPAVRIALALLLIAAIGNVVGALSVSRLIGRATLSSTYTAIAIYAIARIAGGAATALMRSATARKLRLVRDHGALVRRRIQVFIQWAAALAWIATSLRFFRIDDDVYAAVKGIVTAKLELGTMSLSLGDLLAFALTIWLAFTLSRFLRFVLEEDVLPHVSLPRGVPAAISTGAHYVILLLGFVLAMGAAGIDLSRFGLLAGAFGVGIGFGLQNIVNNFVSGLILLFERPVQNGDIIEVGTLTGEVQRIGIRSSTIRTAEGADVIVPNASLIAERVVNWTFSDRQRRVDVNVGVAYDADPEKVIALLVGVGRAHPEVLSIPEPVALFVGFGESSLDFSLRVWTRFEIFPRVRSELGIAVRAALGQAGIEIPYPQRDMNLKPAPGTAAEILASPLPPIRVDTP
jgi:small-conductance mechanosensitive channel